jgi:DNA polymerase-3 subunit beta
MVATDGHRLSYVEKPNENPRRHQRRKARPHPAQGPPGAAAVALQHRRRKGRVRRRRAHALLPRRPSHAQHPQALRPVPQLRSRHAARQHQVRRRPLQRALLGHPARRPVCRRALRRHPPAPGGNELKISSSSTESGESEDTIDTPYSSDPIAVGFNSGYILDFLKALNNEGEVRLEFKDSSPPARCAPKIPTPSTSTATCSCPCASDASGSPRPPSCALRRRPQPRSAACGPAARGPRRGQSSRPPRRPSSRR